MNKVTVITSALRRVCPLGLLLAGVIVTSATGLEAATGTDHGFFWQNYVSSGSSTISFPSAGTYPGNFAVSYSNVGDVVAGKGWNPGSSTKVINYNIGALSGSYNFVGVYGWTTNPLIEYYVCELGSITYAAQNVGSVSSDGHTYGLWKHQQVNQPSIIGTATFWQYMSQWGGSGTGSSRSITIANHMNAWRSKMGSLGSNNMQIFAIEAYSNKSGYINATVW
jgi:endo-1,4-beta-xylanase